MSLADVLRLTSVQAQVVQCVVRWVAVNVVDNLGRIKITTKRLFNYPSMFKDVLHPRWFHVCGVRMIVSRDHEHVSISPNLPATLPAWREVLAFAVHGVGFAGKPAPIHGVALAADIAGVRRVCGGQVARSTSARPRAVLSRTARRGIEGCAALNALLLSTLALRCSGTGGRAKAGPHGWEGIVHLATLFTGSLNHAFRLPLSFIILLRGRRI